MTFYAHKSEFESATALYATLTTTRHTQQKMFYKLSKVVSTGEIIYIVLFTLYFVVRVQCRR